MKFKFVTEEFHIEEGKESDGWIRVGGIALVEGTSRNGNKYKYDNLAENNGREFKWVYGHPSEHIEEHVVGKGVLKLVEGKLIHEGRIRNTARHPDVVESVRDGFLGPSIQASFKSGTKTEEGFEISGLSIDLVGLVALQGVREASIDYAIAEQLDLVKKEGEITMAEEQTAPVEVAVPVVEAVAAPAPIVEAPVEQPKVSNEEYQAALDKVKKLEEQLNVIKDSKKVELVESLIKVNGALNKDDLLKESEDGLKLRLEYESKLANTKVESAAIVETRVVEESKAFAVENDGSYSMTKESYNKFNKEIRERVR